MWSRLVPGEVDVEVTVDVEVRVVALVVVAVDDMCIAIAAFDVIAVVVTT